MTLWDRLKALTPLSVLALAGAILYTHSHPAATAPTERPPVAPVTVRPEPVPPPERARDVEPVSPTPIPPPPVGKPCRPTPIVIVLVVPVTIPVPIPTPVPPPVIPPPVVPPPTPVIPVVIPVPVSPTPIPPTPSPVTPTPQGTYSGDLVGLLVLPDSYTPNQSALLPGNADIETALKSRNCRYMAIPDAFLDTLAPGLHSASARLGTPPILLWIPTGNPTAKILDATPLDATGTTSANATAIVNGLKKIRGY